MKTVFPPGRLKREPNCRSSAAAQAAITAVREQDDAISALKKKEVFISRLGILYPAGEADEESIPLREQSAESGEGRWPGGKRKTRTGAIATFRHETASACETNAARKQVPAGW